MSLHNDDPILPVSDTDGDGWIGNLRKRMASDLVGSLDKALGSYRRFSVLCPVEGSKSYAAHQSGCRAALAHIHLLIKLLEWASAQGSASLPDTGDPELNRLLDEARIALARPEEVEGDEEEEP